MYIETQSNNKLTSPHNSIS